MATADPLPHGAERVYRHRLPVRLMHWINVVCLVILLGSGLNIFNAHPALYWGKDSHFASPWLSIRAEDSAAGPVGVTGFAGREWRTTGVFGLSEV
ncbi:MAG TPA: cytochrome b/b6 domain-containing protein, partial [Burkholderiaceae bacterium]